MWWRADPEMALDPSCSLLSALRIQLSLPAAALVTPLAPGPHQMLGCTHRQATLPCAALEGHILRHPPPLPYVFPYVLFSFFSSFPSSHPTFYFIASYHQGLSCLIFICSLWSSFPLPFSNPTMGIKELFTLWACVTLIPNSDKDIRRRMKRETTDYLPIILQ